MKLSWVCLASCCILQHTIAIPTLAKREADFDSVNLLSHLDRPYLQTQEQQTPSTYFQPSSFTTNYDARFASQPLIPEAHHLNLKALAQSYLLSMNDLGIPTWLTHKTLLSWYQTGKLQPAQSQIDVMVSRKSMHFLAEFCNMTVYSHKIDGTGRKRRSYLLEVSPFWDERRSDVEARWIDTHTGLCIDVVMDRGEGDVVASYPLLETVFEGVKARVPSGYSDLLVEEYGPEALSSPSDY